MKQIFVLRHAQKNILTGGITKKGEEECNDLKKMLPEFRLVLSSEKKRCIHTAEHLINQEPKHDSRANIEHDSGEELIALIKETLPALKDNENALIISHKPTMIPAYLKLSKKNESSILFGSLEGFIVNEKLDVRLFQVGKK